jgi:hypothetical protein
MQITQGQAIQPEWRPEEAGTGTRSKRVLSIEELRTRLGLAGIERPAASPAQTEERTRPRIVRRHEALAG